MPLSDSEPSDEDDSDVQVPELSNRQADVDEAVTGYIPEGSAETVLVKSKAEAHDQVSNWLDINCHIEGWQNRLLYSIAACFVY